MVGDAVAIRSTPLASISQLKDTHVPGGRRRLQDAVRALRADLAALAPGAIPDTENRLA